MPVVVIGTVVGASVRRGIEAGAGRATRRGENTMPPSNASPTIMIGPPTNSASANCQPISTSNTTPSSTTRFVDANMKIIAVVKSAPFWNSDFAIAVAA